MVGGGGTCLVACFRGWIHDRELQTSARISERVKIITGLEVDQRDPTGPSSAEAMQVTVLPLSLSLSLTVSLFISLPLTVCLFVSLSVSLSVFLP